MSNHTDKVTKQDKGRRGIIETLGIVAGIAVCCFAGIGLIPPFVSMFQSFGSNPVANFANPKTTSISLSTATNVSTLPSQTPHVNLPTPTVLPTNLPSQLPPKAQTSVANLPQATLAPTVDAATSSSETTYYCTSNLGDKLRTIDASHPSYQASLGTDQTHDYGFEIKANQSVRFVTESQFPIELSIYDSDRCNQLILEVEFKENSGKYQTQLDFVPNYDGNFFVRVDSSYSSGNGLYSLSRRDNPVQVPQPQVQEGVVVRSCTDRPIQKLPTLDGNHRVYQASLPLDQTHDYGFVLKANKSVRFAIESQFPIKLAIYDAKRCEQLILEEDFKESSGKYQTQLDFVPNYDSNFFVRVDSSYSSGNGLYVLTRRDDSLQVPQLQASQNEITTTCVGKPSLKLPLISTASPAYQASLPVNQTHDYGFELKANQMVRFVIDSQFPIKLAIHDANNCDLLVLEEDFKESGGRYQTMLDFVTNNDDKFFVRVDSSYSSGNGLYTLTFRMLN